METSQVRDTFLHLSISGRPYDIPESTVKEYPGSVLALLVSSSRHHEPDEKRMLAMRRIIAWQSETEKHPRWYAERTPMMFEMVLQYVHTGQLHCPESVCQQALKDELKFWRLGDAMLAECCWDDVEKTENEDQDSGVDTEFQQFQEEEKEHDQKLDLNEKGLEAALQNRRATLVSIMSSIAEDKKKKKWRNVVFFLRRMCHGSSAFQSARIFRAVGMFFIILSIVSMIVGTMPRFHCKKEYKKYNETYNDFTDTRDKFSLECAPLFIFNVIEAVCIAWFTFELTIRFLTSTNKKKFVKSPMNIIDLLATLPFYVDLCIWLIDPTATNNGVSTLMVVLRILRVLRIFRVLRLARYFKSLKLFAITMAKSRDELQVLAVFIMLSVVLCGSVLYYIEKDVPNTLYTSIPASLYWAVVTLTTTGYGDMAPTTPLGKAFTGVVCVMGILILAFPVSILVEHLNETYKAKKNNAKRKRVFESNPKKLSTQNTGMDQRKLESDHGSTAVSMVDFTQEKSGGRKSIVATNGSEKTVKTKQNTFRRAQSEI